MSSIYDFVGTPFKEKGRDCNGVDCWGLVYLVYKKFKKINLPTYSDSYTLADKKEIQRLISGEKSKWKKVENPQIFDVLLFRINGTVSHTGIFVGKGKFIHALEDVGVVVESIYSVLWRKRLVGVYRYD